MAALIFCADAAMEVQGAADTVGQMEAVSLTGNPPAEDVFRRRDLYRQGCSEEDFTRLLPHLLTELFYSLRVFGESGPTGGVYPLRICRLHRLLSELRFIFGCPPSERDGEKCGAPMEKYPKKP